MPANETLPSPNERHTIRVINISPLSAPTFAAYSTRSGNAWEIDGPEQSYPVRFEAIAMWALVEVNGWQQITGVHLRDLLGMQYCGQASNLLGYSESSDPVNEIDFQR